MTKKNIIATKFVFSCELKLKSLIQVVFREMRKRVGTNIQKSCHNNIGHAIAIADLTLVSSRNRRTIFCAQLLSTVQMKQNTLR